MRIDLVFPVLPPTLDGIGDHTARLAEALAASGCSVRVLTAQPNADAIPGVVVKRAFSINRRNGIRDFAKAVREDPPDWLFVQFNQFSYGRWGLNPYLPFTLRSIKRALPRTRIAWMAHEEFVPPSSLQFAIMTLWQRWQFWMLGRTADLIFFSIAPWIRRFASWFPQTPMRHLPVGSNIPDVGLKRAEARRQLNLDDDTFVVGYFGTLHGSRLLPLVHAATHRLLQQSEKLLVLYVGPDGSLLREALGSAPVRDAGPLPAEEVSRHFSAMDLYLTPILGGVSTRRGSFMTGIQHGIATVGTRGRQTDRMLLEANEEAFLFADEGDAGHFVRCVTDLFENPAARAQLARHGQQFYRNHFDWPVAATRLQEALHDVDAARTGSTTFASLSTEAVTP